MKKHEKLSLGAGLLALGLGLAAGQSQAAGIQSPILAKPVGADAGFAEPVRWCWYGYWQWVPGPYCGYGGGPYYWGGGPYWGGRGYWRGGPGVIYRGGRGGGMMYRGGGGGGMMYRGGGGGGMMYRGGGGRHR